MRRTTKGPTKARSTRLPESLWKALDEYAFQTGRRSTNLVLIELLTRDMQREGHLDHEREFVPTPEYLPHRPVDRAPNEDPCANRPIRILRKDDVTTETNYTPRSENTRGQILPSGFHLRVLPGGLLEPNVCRGLRGDGERPSTDGPAGPGGSI